MSLGHRSEGSVATATAGLRGTIWNPDLLPGDVSLTAHALTTADGASVTGYLFRRGGERTVVCSMHPRECVVTNFVVPEVLQGGCAMWVMAPRSPGNDLRLEHETALLDLAAGQIFLRETMGFEYCILQGTSGGGPLAAFYCQQAGRAPAARLTHSPGGRPVKLASATMPLPDGVIFMSAHPGQGQLLLTQIDPAVTDEGDPFRIDEGISAFSTANGFRKPPESSSYAPEFLARYRAAQRARIVRIDAFARQLLERKADARRRSKAGGDEEAAALAAHSPIFQVWRTDADPRCFDLSLDPSDRAYGSVWGANPLVSNLGSIGFARTCTPEGWLSNWSALSTNVSMEACAPDLAVPVQVIEFTGDNSVFPSDAARIFEAIGSADKERHAVHGNHHGQPIVEGAANGQRVAGQLIRNWLEHHRFR
ncbi:alpha/beta hydrolase [Sphingomonas cavernae]|uniref:Alpha/beta hydrolase n=2 Tax=Sphingomonas cavernae TaxID=2320861 RepID=A0A418WN79_9SPHN|nr:alpha/beta hydrolase [Sphingomonas cavernae]